MGVETGSAEAMERAISERERNTRLLPPCLVISENLQPRVAPLHYPHLSHSEIVHSVEEFYRSFYFRAPKIASIVKEMALSPEMLIRRMREAVEFFGFLRERRGIA